MHKKMDYEPLLTILFALGIAAALIAYAAFPRGRPSVSMAHSASIGSFAPANVGQAVQMTEVAAVEPPTVQTSSISETTTAVAAPTPVVSAIEVPAIATTQVAEEATATSHTAAKPRRSTRKKSTTTKTRARRSPKVQKS